MSRVWLQSAAELPGLEIVGLADIDIERARARAAEFALPDAFATNEIDSLLARCRPDALFDVVPPSERHRVVSTGLAAGCHVLSEKPMAQTIAEARDLVAKAAAAKRLHAVVQNRRYLPAVRRIARSLRGGIVGDVTSVHADFFLAPHFGGFREDMDHILLPDMAIHGFDAMRCMTGFAAKGVYCREWNPPRSWYRNGSSASAIFDLEGGAVFDYRGSWCAQGQRTSWECAWRFVGARGTLVWDEADSLSAEVAGDGRDCLFDNVVAVPISQLDPTDRADGHIGVLSDFVAAIAAGKEPETVGHDNIRSLAMALGAIEGAQAWRHVEIKA
jgi:predicted dehydrogenase